MLLKQLLSEIARISSSCLPGVASQDVILTIQMPWQSLMGLSQTERQKPNSRFQAIIPTAEIGSSFRLD
jgi:hypothetical protein